MGRVRRTTCWHHGRFFIERPGCTYIVCYDCYDRDHDGSNLDPRPVGRSIAGKTGNSQLTSSHGDTAAGISGVVELLTDHTAAGSSGNYVYDDGRFHFTFSHVVFLFCFTTLLAIEYVVWDDRAEHLNIEQLHGAQRLAGMVGLAAATEARQQQRERCTERELSHTTRLSVVGGCGGSTACHHHAVQHTGERDYSTNGDAIIIDVTFTSYGNDFGTGIGNITIIPRCGSRLPQDSFAATSRQSRA